MKTFLRKCLVLIAMLAPLCGVSAQDKEVAVFKSADVVTTTTYAVYQNDDWYISRGGYKTSNDDNPYGSIGFSKAKVIKLDKNLGTGASTSNYGVYVTSKKSLESVYKVTFTTTTGSGGSGKIYLASSTDGENWNQVEGTEGQLLSATDNNITFEFDRIDAAYFGVVLDKGNASATNYRFDNVVMTFYAATGDPNKKNTKLTFKQETYNFNVGAGDQEIVDIPVLTEDGINTPPIEGATITYTSSNEDIAIFVEGTVVVYTKVAGTATITAEYAGDDTYNGCKAEYTINVNKVATSIAFAQGDVTYTVGDENNAAVYENPATLSPASAGTVTYKSSDEVAAEVDESGTVLVDTSKPGKYTITASYAGNDSYEASEASYTIEVKKPVFPGTGSYVMITSNEGIVDGGHYIIANTENGKAMKVFESGSNYKTVDVEIANNTISSIPEATAIVQLQAQNNGRYALLDMNNSKYLAITTGNNNSNSLKTSDNINERLTNASIAIAENGDATIKFNVDNTLTRNTIKYNPNNGNTTGPLFSCYSGGQKPVQMYCETYTRASEAGNFGTLCLPYGGTVKGADLYQIEAKQLTEGVVTSISLTKVADNKAEAGVPYIFQATANQVQVLYAGEIAVTPASNNGLIGSYNGTAVEEGNYVISNNTVKKCGKNSKIGTNRCYIDMEQVPEKLASANAIIISFTDTTDAIESIEAGADSRNAIYDLSGRHVKAAKKGLYIVNGKKIIK